MGNLNHREREEYYLQKAEEHREAAIQEEHDAEAQAAFVLWGLGLLWALIKFIVLLPFRLIKWTLKLIVLLAKAVVGVVKLLYKTVALIIKAVVAFAILLYKTIRGLIVPPYLWGAKLSQKLQGKTTPLIVGLLIPIVLGVAIAIAYPKLTDLWIHLGKLVIAVYSISAISFVIGLLVGLVRRGKQGRETQDYTTQASESPKLPEETQQ